MSIRMRALCCKVEQKSFAAFDDLGQSAAAVARGFHVSPNTVGRWVERSPAPRRRSPRSCRHHASPTATPPSVLEQVERRCRPGSSTTTRIELLLFGGHPPIRRLAVRYNLVRLHT